MLGRVLPTVPEGHQEYFRKNMENLISGATVLDVETKAQRKDGSIIDISIICISDL